MLQPYEIIHSWANFQTYEIDQNTKFPNSNESAAGKSLCWILQGKQAKNVNGTLQPANDLDYVGRQCFDVDEQGKTDKTL